jgi:Cytochrome c554 and c-prime
MKKIIVVAIILAILLAVIYLKFGGDKPGDPRGNLYAGSFTCIKCHSEIYKSYLHTAHYLASLPASPETVHGSFSEGTNVFEIDDSQKIVMEKKDSGMFQSYYLNEKVKESRRFDIVLGGVKGESYLYWNGNALNQLPVSWYTKEHKWLLSPRFDPRYVNFNRSIRSRCFECHAAYIGDQPAETQRFNEAEQFDESTLVYNVDCERCHGPGARHADFQTDHPKLKTAKFITSFSSLPRARRMDVCGVCHSGNKSVMLRSTFWFQPGDTFAKFKVPDFIQPVDSASLDVHGNQLQLLESSKCFINSKMDCATCHDPHQNQRGNTVMFTQKCLSCHSTDNHNYCKMANSFNLQFIKSNCIQCHMPALPSRAVESATLNNTLSADIFVHTHHIAIYPQEVKKVLAYMGK